MHELLLLRHAEAQPAALDGDDFLRPLTAGGRDAARAAAQRLALIPWRPERILYSPALRTMETAALVASVLGLGAAALVAVPALYLATPPALRSALRDHHGGAQRLMIVGHNPALSEWGTQLTVEHEGESLPTAGYWLIDCPLEAWRQLVGP